MKGAMVRKLGAVAVLAASLAVAAPVTSWADSPADGGAFDDSGIMVIKNSTDTGFYFSMASKGSTSATGYRRKDDTSAVYVQVTDCYGAPRMYVDGASSDTGAGNRDCTNGTYRARTTGKFVLHNSVKESGLSYARLTSWAESGKSLVSGLWSPDSLGSYSTMGA